MIYCLEDERNIRELIVYTLESSGFHAAGFSNGTDFLPQLLRKYRIWYYWILCCQRKTV